MTKEAVRDRILEESKKGNICFNSIEGIMTCSLDSFTKQPLEGMLYDLNRDDATILSFIDDPKWINDYALVSLLRYYYNTAKELQSLKIK